ncbi:MAG: nicotinate phosphoribosyltransferase [Thermosulfidibacteraceae bacterium]
MNFGFLTPENMALLTDLYELTMADSYYRAGINDFTTFDLFVRELPENRNFLVSCGLEQILYYLENIRFSKDAIEYLRSLKIFSEEFLGYLKDFRFGGEVWAIPEGEIYFNQEPVIRVTARRIEAQIIETFLLNIFNFQSMIASKSARVVLTAKDKSVVDFSARRDHSTDASIKTARASFIAGCVGTSNVLAGRLYGIPVIGTMAHSYVMSFPNELESFRTFAEHFPENTVLLIDTYDVIEGAKNAIIVAKEMEKRGYRLRGVRIDSGDLAELSKKVRKMLDEENLNYVRIVLSGDLNEYKIEELLEKGAKADVFGVGTEMGVSKDAPSLGGVYKLVEDKGGPKIKLSTGKITLPGKKQVWRVVKDGIMIEDIICLEDEPPPSKDAYPLLVKVMDRGKVIIDYPSISKIREFCISNYSKLPEEAKKIRGEKWDYPVKVSNKLRRMTEKLEKMIHYHQ